MAQVSVNIARPDVRRFFVRAAIVFAGYYLAGKLGQATTEIRSSNLGPVWPAYGVALAAVVLCGYRIAPILAGAAFLVAVQSPVPAITALGQATGATFAALTGGFLLQRVHFDPSLSRLRDALGLIVLGALASAIFSASLGVTVLYDAGLQAYSGIGRGWLVYWLGDATGVLIVTPLIFTGTSLLKLARPARVEFAVLVVLVVLASLTIFGDLPLFAIRLHVLAFLLLPFIIWASIRFGVGGSAVSSLLVAAVATVATALGRGPFAQNATFTSAVLLDVFFAVLCVSGLMLAAVIAEREKAEDDREQLIRRQATLDARLRLAAIVESSEDAIVGLDVNGVITDWNAGAARLYGYDEGEAIGSAFSTLTQPASLPAGENSGKMSNAVSRRETVHFRKDGTRIEVSLTTSPIHDAAGRVVGTSAIAHDITDRQQVANALRESEDKLRLILDSAAEGIYGVDTEDRCTFCNQASLRLLGYESDAAVLGHNMHNLVHHSRPDGTPFPAEDCPFKQVLYTDQGIHVGDEVMWRADGSSFHAEVWAYPQKRCGEVVGCVVGFSDITQQLQTEESAATLRDELAHLSRVGMLGALSGALAHEINQPLAAVRINAEAALSLLEALDPPPHELRDVLTDIREDNQRAGEVLQHMRTLLKKNPARLEEVQVNATVTDVVRLTKSHALRHGITVNVELSPWMKPIVGDRVQVQQVILNLLMNACDAVENNDKTKRRVSLKTIPHKDEMVIEVKDEGTGVSDEELEHIFEPFYTTKHEGLGLGLSICQSIVAAHGGTLEAKGNSSGGMTFSAMFPTQQHAPAALSQNYVFASQASLRTQ